MSVTQSTTPPPTCEARDARDLWLDAARAYRDHCWVCPPCRHDAACPDGSDLAERASEAYDALGIEYDEDRPPVVVAVLVVAAVASVAFVALLFVALLLLGRI